MTFVDIIFASDVMQVAGARLRSFEGAHQGPTGTASVALKGCQMTFLRWSILQDDYFSSICLFGNEPRRTKVQLEWENTRAYIRSLVEIMDWRKLSIRDAYQILVTMFVKGGGDPEDPQISLSSVQRIVEEVRGEATQKIREQKFPERVVLHFD